MSYNTREQPHAFYDNPNDNTPYYETNEGHPGDGREYGNFFILFHCGTRDNRRINSITAHIATPQVAVTTKIIEYIRTTIAVSSGKLRSIMFPRTVRGFGKVGTHRRPLRGNGTQLQGGGGG